MRTNKNKGVLIQQSLPVFYILLVSIQKQVFDPAKNSFRGLNWSWYVQFCSVFWILHQPAFIKRWCGWLWHFWTQASGWWSIFLSAIPLLHIIICSCRLPRRSQYFHHRKSMRSLNARGSWWLKLETGRNSGKKSVKWEPNSKVQDYVYLQYSKSLNSCFCDMLSLDSGCCWFLFLFFVFAAVGNLYICIFISAELSTIQENNQSWRGECWARWGSC